MAEGPFLGPTVGLPGGADVAGTAEGVGSEVGEGGEQGARASSNSNVPTGWPGHLVLNYRRIGARCVAQDRHEGPLRVLKPLYPEGDAVCHHVIVHPPGGIVGGDRLRIEVDVGAQAHAVITTPGATRFYRSAGALGAQQARLRVAAGGRLEWLPLENIAHPGCEALNSTEFELAPGAQMMGWDLLALGLPAASAAFTDMPQGRFRQTLAWPGRWLEQATLAAGDTALLDGAAGLAGRRALATLWFASGDALAPALTGALLDAARAVLDERAPAPPGAFNTPPPDAFAELPPGAFSTSPPGATAGSPPGAFKTSAPGTFAAALDDPSPGPRLIAGATASHPGLVVVRALADRIEPLFDLLAAVRGTWRGVAWNLPAVAPRVWST